MLFVCIKNDNYPRWPWWRAHYADVQFLAVVLEILVLTTVT